MATRGGRGRGLGLRIGVPSRTANAARPQPLPLPVPQALPMPPAGAAAAAAAAAKGAPTSVQPLPVAAINGGAGSGAGGASGTGSGAAGGTALGVAGAGNAVKAPMMVFTPREDVALEDLERILPPLGFGSGGRVYRVRHKKTGKEYALKVIQEKYDEEVRKQIIQEMQILRRARSDHVVECYGIFDHLGEISFVLELMDGGTLADVTKKRGKIPESFMPEVTRQCLQGLLYLHRQHVVHRDIKPSNLLFNRQGQVKIADFGVSKELASTLAQCNSYVGTSAYLSPERINPPPGEGYDGYLSDVWSMGLSLLELVIGRFPYVQAGQSADWMTLFGAIVFNEPPEAPGSCSPEFQDFIRCCLQKEPKKRKSAAELLEHPFCQLLVGDPKWTDLKQLLPPQPAQPPQQPRLPPQLHPNQGGAQGGQGVRPGPGAGQGTGQGGQKQQQQQQQQQQGRVAGSQNAQVQQRQQSQQVQGQGQGQGQQGQAAVAGAAGQGEPQRAAPQVPVAGMVLQMPTAGLSRGRNVVLAQPPMRRGAKAGQGQQGTPQQQPQQQGRQQGQGQQGQQQQGQVPLPQQQQVYQQIQGQQQLQQVQQQMQGLKVQGQVQQQGSGVAQPAPQRQAPQAPLPSQRLPQPVQMQGAVGPMGQLGGQQMSQQTSQQMSFQMGQQQGMGVMQGFAQGQMQASIQSQPQPQVQMQGMGQYQQQQQPTVGGQVAGQQQQYSVQPGVKHYQPNPQMLQQLTAAQQALPTQK